MKDAATGSLRRALHITDLEVLAAALTQADAVKWGKLIKELGITAQ